MTWERLGRFLWAPAPREDKATCPLWADPVNGWPGMRLPQLQGYWAPGREELIAHCPTHGHPPYNNPDPGGGSPR